MKYKNKCTNNCHGQRGEADFEITENGSKKLLCKKCHILHTEDGWALMGRLNQEGKAKKRDVVHRQIEKLKISDRIKFVNEGTVLLDDKFFYYTSKKKARTKGNPKYYQMRSFSHFVEVFGNNC